MGLINKKIKSKSCRKLLHNALYFSHHASKKISLKLYDTRLKEHKPRKIVSEKYKFIYIENPLSASQSVLNSIYRKGKRKYQTYSTRNWCNISKDKIDNYKKFTVKRNPWERVVSCYNKKILNALSLARIAIIAQFDGLYPQMSFGKFIEWLCSGEGSDGNANKHWVSQYKIIYEESPMPPDVVIELKNFEYQYRQFFEEVGAPIPKIYDKGASKDQYIKTPFENKKKHYNSLSNERFEKIENRYKKDCKMLGYPRLADWV